MGNTFILLTILEHQIPNKNNLQEHGERLFELLGYIKFVCWQIGVRNAESYVLFPQEFGCTDEVTTKQFEWIYANLDNMSKLQRWYCKDSLRYFYEKETR